MDMRISVEKEPYTGTIPRLIHQTYFTGDFPDEVAQNVEKLRTLNPDWDYHFYDDDAVSGFIAQHYGEAVLQVFNSINPDYGAARADLFRYLALYRLGGIYLDIKSAADRPLAEVVHPDDSFILSQWRNRIGEPYPKWGIHPELSHIPGGEYQQWFIVSAPGHPFLHAVIDQVLGNVQNYDPERTGSGRLGVLRVTGTIAFSQAIHPLRSSCPHRAVRDQTELGFRYSIYERDGRQLHRSIFRTDYPKLGTPIVMRSAD